jgi:hypothetical protein
MKKEICGTFHAKCGMQDLTKVFETVPRKAGWVVTLITSYMRKIIFNIILASIPWYSMPLSIQVLQLKFYSNLSSPPCTAHLILDFIVLTIFFCNWESSVTAVTDYGLDDRSSIPHNGNDFSCSPCVQTGSGALPASYPMGTEGSFPRR